MGMLDRITTAASTLEEIDESTQARVTFMSEQLDAATNTIEMLEESFADVALAREDVGWRRLDAWSTKQFTRDGLNRSSDLCRIMVSASPLVKRGLALRHAYVFGKGVEIEARDREATELVELVQEFMRVNRDSMFGSQAQEELERALGTDGNLFLAHFTKPLTGKVKVRSIPFHEIAERICNPEDRDEPWYYLRRWTTTEITRTGRTETVRNEAYYPDLRHRPRAKPKMIDDVEVMWDAPILHVSVNRLDGWDFGIGDAFSSIDWARAYSGFLNDWAKLMKALAKYAWTITGDKKGNARGAAAEVRRNNAAQNGRAAVQGESVGDTAVMAGAKLEAIPKSGATLDSESGRPLATMVAAGLGLPVTQLLADPGQTGARAVAETLSKPTILEFKGRQRLWRQAYGDSIEYQVLQAVRAPRGPLAGTIIRDEWEAEIVTLAADADATIDITFPELDDIDPKAFLEAVAIADGLEKVPDLVILRAALMAIPGVDDIDDIIDTVTDDEGNFIVPETASRAGQAMADAYRRLQNQPDETDDPAA